MLAMDPQRAAQAHQHDGHHATDDHDILEVPLRNPSAARHIGYVPMQHGSLGSTNGCHDAGLILGDVNLSACASGHAANVFSVGGPRGGTLENPLWLYNIEEEDDQGNNVGIGARRHAGPPPRRGAGGGGVRPPSSTHHHPWRTRSSPRGGERSPSRAGPEPLTRTGSSPWRRTSLVGAGSTVVSGYPWFGDWSRTR
jgi:hypothetical protein